MSNYILGPNGDFVSADELYHAWFKKGEESDDHKYIKREWKHGKWVYTYPSDTKKDVTKLETFKIPTKKKNAIRFNNVALKTRSMVGKFDRASNHADLVNRGASIIETHPLSSRSEPKEHQMEIEDSSPKIKSIGVKNKDNEYIENDTSTINEFKSRAESLIRKGNTAVDEAAVKLNINDTKRMQSLSAKGESSVDIATNGFLDDVLNNIALFFLGIEGRKVIKKHDEDAWKNYTIDDLPRDAETESVRDDMLWVNPFYGTYDEYSYNCGYCSAVYELRRRGYDVTAKPSTESVLVSEQAAWYEPPAKVTTNVTGSDYTLSLEGVFTKDDIKYMERSMLRQYGPNARGVIAVRWYQGGGHSMIWETTDDGVIVRDTQTCTTHSLADFAGMFDVAQYFRTDNLELSDSILEAVYIDESSRNKFKI